tara:strand:+ start:3080 stop:3688 length:609 start_codon:yes stop_codon:yes gene_type:complete
MFLQLKKSTHIDKTLSVQLRVDPINIKGVMNKFNNLEYELPVTNIGNNYSAEKWGDKEPITFKKGDHFNLKVSSALYGKLTDFSKAELVDITMTSTEKGVKYNVGASFSVWDKPVHDEGVTSKPYGYDSVKSRDDDRSLEIKWGMAFNNATRLFTNSKMLYEDKVKAIETIMPKMFEIACGMKSIIETETPKIVEDDDDAPF